MNYRFEMINGIGPILAVMVGQDVRGYVAEQADGKWAITLAGIPAKEQPAMPPRKTAHLAAQDILARTA